MSTAPIVPRIARWTCRLGNNLLQISNALYFAERMGSHVEVPRHSCALLRSIGPGTLMPPIQHPYTVKAAVYFYDTDMRQVGGSPTVQKRRALLLKHLAPRIESAISQHVRTDPTALYIHIRSGDLFAPQTRRPHPEYWQPPLSWYHAVIRAHRQEHGASAPVIVVTEPDQRNPCIAALRLAYEHVTIQSQSIEDDFATLMRAQHVACAYGTFSVAAILLSSSVRTVHVPVWAKPRPHMLHTWTPSPEENVNVIHYRLDDYPRGAWQNTPEQVAHMLQYT